MPSKRRSNRQAKKAKHLTANTQPNHHSSPALQFPGKGDLKVLRDQNGRCGNDRDQMEGSVDGRLDLLKIQKVEESQSEGKGVIVVDKEDVKSIVESGGEVAAETLDGEDLNVVVQSEETSVLVDSEKVEETKEASEPILATPNDSIDATEQPDDAELKLKEDQEKDLVIPEKTDEGVEEKELNNEISSGLANIVNSRETEEAVETTEAEENKLASLEEKDALSSVATPKAIEETTIVKPDESEESKLPAEDEKIGESSSVVQEPSKDQDTNETSGSTVQDKTEVPRSTENQTTPCVVAQRQYTSWSSCCGLFEVLRGGDR